MTNRAEVDAIQFAVRFGPMAVRQQSVPQAYRLGENANIGAAEVLRCDTYRSATVHAGVWRGGTQVPGMHLEFELRGDGSLWRSGTCKVTFPDTTQMTFVAEVRNHQLTVRRSEG